MIIKPPLSLETKKVFAEINKQDFSGKSQEYPEDLSDIDDFWHFMQQRNNDMSRAAIKLCPEIADILNYNLSSDQAIIRMSGSGPACFIIFKDKKISSEIRLKFQYDSFDSNIM